MTFHRGDKETISTEFGVPCASKVSLSNVPTLTHDLFKEA